MFLDPAYLQRREVMVDQEGQASDWYYEELHSKSVVVAIISGFELHVDQVDGGIGASYVDDLLWETDAL